MFSFFDAIHLTGSRAAISAMEFNCPVCKEPINYCPPDAIGYCSCGYNTEENYVDPRTEDDYYERTQDE